MWVIVFCSNACGMKDFLEVAHGAQTCDRNRVQDAQFAVLLVCGDEGQSGEPSEEGDQTSHLMACAGCGTRLAFCVDS